MSKRMVRSAAGLMVCLLCACMLVLGQSTSGSIGGTVTDSTGAAIPNGKVTLTNLGTGTKLQIATTQNGTFNFRNLMPGTYSVRVDVPGFAAQERTGLQLYANQSVTNDIQMMVAGTQSTVQVNAEAAAIDTQNSDLSDVLTGSALVNVPVLSRQDGGEGIYSDLYFMPGSQNPNSNSVGNGNGNSSGTPTIDGARQVDTMVTMDGMAVMANVGDEGGTPIQPSEEGIQEIHSVLADAPAEFWRSSAVTVVTKAGTNEMHGSLYEDYNGSALNAKSFFATSIPFRVDNNFAASLGGPVKKDKLFYFGDYEGGREIGRAVVNGNVPLPAWRSGNFSGLPYSIMNPYTGHPFPGNQIPAGMISPVALSLQNAIFPLPNYGPPGLQSGNYRALIPAVNGWQDFDNADASIEWTPGQKDTLFVRESYRHLPKTSFIGNIPSVGHFVENRVAASGVVSETHIFSPNLVNEIRLGYTDMRLAYHMTYGGYSAITQAGMQGPFTGFPSIPDVPGITINSITPTAGLLPNTSDNQKDYEWNDNVSWTWGKHLLKFGVDEIFDHPSGFSNPGSIYGNYNFNGKFSGNGYADFLLGLPQQTSLTTPVPTSNLHGIVLGAYAQDQYQVNARLTVNYGLRWEFQGPYSGAPNLLYNFDPKTGAEVIENQAGLAHLSPYFPSKVVPVETAAQAGYPSGSLMFSHYLNFYPRVGFAYKIFDNTVLRGAYGVYANSVYAADALGQLYSGGPFTGSATFYNQNTSTGPAFSFPRPFLASGTLSTQTAAGTDPHMTVPYTQQWNLAVEQQVGPNATVTVSYIGAASRNLLEIVNLDQPPPSTTPFTTSELAYPNYSAVEWTQNGGVDNYNSLQVLFRANKGRNLTLDTGFTFARDLTDEQDMGSDAGYPPENRFCIGCDYGPNGLTRRIDYYVNLNYMLPVGRGQAYLSGMNGWINGVLGGWDIAADGSAYSGPFFTPMANSGFDTANTNTSFMQRPDQIGNPHVKHQTINNWFNVNAYAIPGCPTTDPLCLNSTPANVGRFGDVKPGSLTGPNYVNFDLSLMKNFHLWREANFELRLTAQNALNHPNFEVPDWYVTDGPGVAGVVTSLAGASLGPRETDILGRFTF